MDSHKMIKAGYLTVLGFFLFREAIFESGHHNRVYKQLSGSIYTSCKEDVSPPPYPQKIKVGITSLSVAQTPTTKAHCSKAHLRRGPTA